MHHLRYAERIQNVLLRRNTEILIGFPNTFRHASNLTACFSEQRLKIIDFIAVCKCRTGFCIALQPTRNRMPVIQCLLLFILSENVKIKYTRLHFCPWFCMGAKFGLWHEGRNTGWEYLRTGCWGYFWARRYEVAGGWWKLCNEVLHNLYSSPIRTVKSRRMRWAVHETQLARRRMYTD
jgi:hypothetical protein